MPFKGSAVQGLRVLERFDDASWKHRVVSALGAEPPKFLKKLDDELSSNFSRTLTP
jgi:hypothetical protein